jgi:hypothetical protein
VDLDSTSVISVVALVFSAIGLYFGAVRPWWQTREAHPEARLESLRYVTDKGRERTDQWLVLVNHGPAVMRDVTVRLVDQEDKDHSASRSLWPPMPIPELHVGQSLHLGLLLTYGEPEIGSAVLTWRDRHLRVQQRRFWLTWRPLVMTRLR